MFFGIILLFILQMAQLVETSLLQKRVHVGKLRSFKYCKIWVSLPTSEATSDSEAGISSSDHRKWCKMYRGPVLTKNRELVHLVSVWLQELPENSVFPTVKYGRIVSCSLIYWSSPLDWRKNCIKRRLWKFRRKTKIWIKIG